MDEFAQSRADDDLFDDDIIPIEPTEVKAAVKTLPKQVQDISLEGAPKGPAAGTHHHRGYNARGARGRGERGRGSERANSRQQSSALQESKYAPALRQSKHALAASAPTASTPTAVQLNLSQPTEGGCAVPPTPTKDPEDQTTADLAHRTKPSTPGRPPAVRGDRTATGGIKKPKLTKEELTAILEKAGERSKTRSDRHAREKADAADFAERESAAEQERIKDAANRRAMEGEREKNRARKMAVMGRREWDAEKNEDFKGASGRTRGNYTRGANGGVPGNLVQQPDDDLKQYRWNGDRGVNRGQGRRRGGESGRGASEVTSNYRNGAGVRPDVAAEIEFPALPATTKGNGDKPTAKRVEQDKASPEVGSATTGPDSWADQVEMSEATKPSGG